MSKVLYKYMPYSTASIVLENQTLRWSTPATLNDPYDIQFDLQINFDRNIVLRDTLDKLWKIFTGELKGHPENKMTSAVNIMRPFLKGIPKENFMRQMEEGIKQSFSAIDENIHRTYCETRDHLATTKILCLTDSPTNQLMWAYYADSNKGVVLRFQDEPGADSPYCTAKKMSYMHDIPKLFENDELSDFLAGLVTFDEKKRINSLIYTKSDAWKHESEWRIFAGDGRDKNAPHEDKKFGSKELTGVVFGCRMPLHQQLALSETITRSYPHAEIFQATPANHSFQLELSPLDINQLLS
ncbi:MULTISPECIES: DUF2971 domain-containing protein [Pseudomonas]|uniref:DUF2971 domain-containing protein n=1 Tax=unclassified Pseudomonas TaxID=196821 RepID=UPI000C25B10D|nr:MULTISPECIES: DUF2971 domain-containing protein [unclassified Pseudomonas]PJK32431.1 hypothetical protein CWC49_03670 [Pseudomonas sp. S09F 262]PJK41919.1 hypothetical protein CWC48_23220 [Pseudomonas sp. S10E 269]